MIEVHGLTKYYGPTRSIENVNFTVEAGEVLGFLGPNGAGKSTTMKLLAGLARPTAGSARVGGFDSQDQHEEVRKILGFLPEAAPVYGDMTVSGFLEFMGGLKGLGHRAAKEEMERTSGLVNLRKERGRLIRNLSKGTRQRVAIAQALLGNPKVLILDEPTVGLDPSQINDVRELIRSLRGKATVILSTHILPEVELTCSRIVIISAGSVVAEGTPQSLVASGRSEIVVAARGDRETFAKVLGGIAGPKVDIRTADNLHEARLDPSTADRRGDIAREIVGAGLELIELRREQPRLEDIFLSAIGKA